MTEDSKYRRYLRSKGVYAHVDAGPTRDYINYLHTHPDGGMTCQAIADAAGVTLSVVSTVRRGEQARVLDSTAKKILAVQYEGVKTTFGAWSDPTGTIRRIQALYAMGFSCVVMAEAMDNPNPRVVWNYMHNKFITAMVQQKVKTMYEKLRYVDPLDMGIFPPVVTRNKKMAQRNGWAPPGCWDDDTMDDPATQPEWTGYCGRLSGALIHLREGQAPCERCARSATNKKNVVDIYKLYDVYQLGKSHAEAAQLMGISKDLYNQYAQFLRTEERVPHKLSSLDKVTRTAYCEACRKVVQAYGQSPSKFVCSNQVKRYREDKGLA